MNFGIYCAQSIPIYRTQILTIFELDWFDVRRRIKIILFLEPSKHYLVELRVGPVGEIVEAK
jgi:hypothetical protein